MFLVADGEPGPPKRSPRPAARRDSLGTGNRGRVAWDYAQSATPTSFATWKAGSRLTTRSRTWCRRCRSSTDIRHDAPEPVALARAGATVKAAEHLCVWAKQASPTRPLVTRKDLIAGADLRVEHPDSRAPASEKSAVRRQTFPPIGGRYGVNSDNLP